MTATEGKRWKKEGFKELLLDAYTIKAARFVRPKHGMWWECRFDFPPLTRVIAAITSFSKPLTAVNGSRNNRKGEFL